MHKVKPHDTGKLFLRKGQLPESFKTNNSRAHLGPEVFQIPSNPCGEISLNIRVFSRPQKGTHYKCSYQPQIRLPQTYPKTIKINKLQKNQVNLQELNLLPKKPEQSLKEYDKIQYSKSLYPTSNQKLQDPPITKGKICQQKQTPNITEIMELAEKDLKTIVQI